MFQTSSPVKIFVASQPVDMRMSFWGLAGAVTEVLGQDPKSGHLFAFLNRRRNLLKVLSWDQNGFCLLCKRLSGGMFLAPEGIAGKNHREITASALSTLMKARHIEAPQKQAVFRDGKIFFEFV